MQKRILCYGDSNTWGYMPGTGVRFGKDVRWPGKVQYLLGSEYEIIEAGLNGRTTVFDDPANPYCNGIKGLGYQLLTSKQIDMVVVSLGTNDLSFVNVSSAVLGMDKLLFNIKNADYIYNGSSPIFRDIPRILLLSPIIPRNEIITIRPDIRLVCRIEEAAQLRDLFVSLAEKHNAYYLDITDLAKPSLIDCIHLDAEGHQAIADAVAETISEIFNKG